MWVQCYYSCTEYASNLFFNSGINSLDYVQYHVHILLVKSKVLKMDAITYTTARAQLASNMNRVCQNHEPLIITRNSQQSVVMLSLEDYQALEETAYLLRSPNNAKRLMDAVIELNAGKGTERTLFEEKLAE